MGVRAGVRRRLLNVLGGQQPSGRRVREDDFDDEFRALVERVRPFTMTSPERLFGLREACAYLIREDIPGDFVECGVWRGGSSMVMALELLSNQIDDREVWLFDTFEGPPEPDARDGELAQVYWQRHLDAGKTLATSPLDDVRRNLESTGFPSSRTHFVAGKVEDTIPAQGPEQIALLRLDTDWYESTRHELDHFWDRLSPGGVLIVDDYGHFEGSRRATDDFFAIRGFRPLLTRLDYTGRLAVKPGAFVRELVSGGG